ncbi:hypothetical protein TrST_g6922 [Triparma strigata]|uniref:Serine hydrolase domain-containing protein n=1 Tax=Triparma strigata TaxID=1606541 RepID=A0A9W7ESH0_9STRA|nr:hypothetical protein TrST_g6922 [Triparma strigata]
MASFFTTPRDSSSTSSSTAPPQTPRIKILCLHGGCHNAPLFKKQLTPLITYLKKRTQSDDVNERVPPYNESSRRLNEQRMWFHEPSSEHTIDPDKLAGVDASLLWLSQCWNSQLQSEPYHGILGFSQGASMGGMWGLIETEQYRCRGLRFFLGVNGYVPCPPPDKGFGGVRREDHHKEAVLDIPSLHIYGLNNDVVTPEESRAVAKRFVDPVVYTHDYGHALPRTEECFNVVAEFLRREGRRLMEDYDPRILSMQAQLKSLEFQAGSMIARESEVNPPRALMAVIDRNAVGGWSGGRRVEPGGGAPCPEDFVKKEGERGKGKKQEGPDRRKRDKGGEGDEGDGGG